MNKKCPDCNLCMELHYDVNLKQFWSCWLCQGWYIQFADGTLQKVDKPVLQGS